MSPQVIVSTTDNPLFLYITDTDMMVVNQGPISHECVFLLNSKDWVRGVMKGDSVLLLSRLHARKTGINSTDFFKQQFESPEVLRDIVKACLQDPSFPNFVKQVDDTLKSLLSKP
ncbi:hypothetical protein HPB50_005553 [Hyalomma asiaticum]|uniref:Uncharacterized protein n=1 Tax=Hyalomma asiaticum TaxID=266040 RepID=A0ACB7SKZ5_HYAAI|nr:hypothetical protein HPB50_005553 [Hyalomma asiaticum]